MHRFLIRFFEEDPVRINAAASLFGNSRRLPPAQAACITAVHAHHNLRRLYVVLLHDALPPVPATSGRVLRMPEVASYHSVHLSAQATHAGLLASMSSCKFAPVHAPSALAGLHAQQICAAEAGQDGCAHGVTRPAPLLPQEAGGREEGQAGGLGRRLGGAARGRCAGGRSRGGGAAAAAPVRQRRRKGARQLRAALTVPPVG